MILFFFFFFTVAISIRVTRNVNPDNRGAAV